MTTSDAKKKGKAAQGPPDPRAHLEPTAKHLDATLSELTAVIGRLTPPAERKPVDLVEALIHIVIASGGPCGVGQAARERIAGYFVDRNEFRLTEAFELEALLADLPVTNLFQRCDDLVQAIRQIYNEQNDVTLEFLREAQVSDRNSFFQRVPGIKTESARFLANLLSFEELLFSDKSTQRVQQRLGLDTKEGPVDAFLVKVRELIAPWGTLPLDVGPRDAKLQLEPVLSPGCLLLRLAPSGRR